MNISIIGGDLRIARLAEMYAKDGNAVYAYGLEKINFECQENSQKESVVWSSKIHKCNNIEQAIASSKIIISGIPLSKDEIKINAPYAQKEITIEELLEKLSKTSEPEGYKTERENITKTFIAGNIPGKFEGKKFKCIDLLKNEELTILNAIPTVEGTIKIVIEKREETIHESNVLICGFGRIGKILCRDFKALGANVYCAARKETDFAWIREQRYIPITYQKLANIGEKFDVIINTVPYMVLKEKELSSLRKDVLIVDVASLPGGIDKVFAEKLKLNLITALGIPGKEMPKTAAKYIKEVISKKL